MPNAGLPQMKDGQVSYPLGPAAFAAALGKLTREIGLNVVGGCCGTTPDHIRELRKAVRRLRRAVRGRSSGPSRSRACSRRST